MELVVKKIDGVLRRNNLGANLMITKLEGIEAEIERVQESWANTEYDAESKELQEVLDDLESIIQSFIDIATEEKEKCCYGDASRIFIIKNLEKLKSRLLAI